MRLYPLFGIILVAMVLAGCQAAPQVCGEGDLRYTAAADLQTLPVAISQEAAEIEIAGKLVAFEQVVHGPLCNNRLSGKVYVACDIEIAPWEKAPNFLEGCDFSVEEGSVITVAAHNNAPYYKGCVSCHASSANVIP